MRDDGSPKALSRWARVVRGCSAAAFATFAAAFSHALAGGSAPSALAVVVSMTFSVLACIALTGRRLARVRLAASVVVSQVAYHALFELFGAPASASVMSTGAHDHTAAITLRPDPDSHSASLLHSSDGMLLAHGVAAVVTIAVILWAVRVIRAAASGTRFILRAWRRGADLAPVEVTPRARPAIERRIVLPVQLRRLAADLALRGPPRVGASAA